MGLFSGKLSITRYRLVGAPEPLILSALNRGFKKYRAQQVRLNNPQAILFGWQAPQSDEDLDFEGSHWDLTHCQIDSGFQLRIQMEARRVPSTLVQHLYRQRLRQREHLKRQERQDLLEEIQQELLTKALPDIKIIDCLWLTARQEIYLFSTAKREQEIFEQLFRSSFSKPLSCHLVKVCPGTMGLPATGKGSDKRVRALMRTTPSVLMAHGSH